MQTQPLHDRFGVEIADVDLREVAAGNYPAIRALFDRHSLLLFKGQSLDDEAHMDLVSLFGPLEDRVADASRAPASAPADNIE